MVCILGGADLVPGPTQVGGAGRYAFFDPAITVKSTSATQNGGFLKGNVGRSANAEEQRVSRQRY